MKKLLALMLALLMTAVCFSACGNKQGTESGTETGTEGTVSSEGSIKIGVIAPLTGEVAVYGNAVNNAVKLYTDKFNAEGGVNGRTIELVVYDDKGDATEALNAYSKLVDNDQVAAIIGPVTSTPTFGVAEASADDGIPCITGTATHPDVTTYGDNFFRTCFEDPFQGGAICAYAYEDLGAAKGAIIYNTADSYSTGLCNSITEKANELGLEVVATEGYGKDDVDFNAQLTNIIASEPDVLFIPDYYNKAYLICKQARDLGFAGTFLGVDGTDGILEIEGVDKSIVEGLYFVNHFAPDDEAPIVQNFIADYTAQFGQAPNALAALGYDAAMVLYTAISQVVEDGAVEIGATEESYAAIRDALKATDIDCVTGHITFDANNNPIKDCKILQIKDGTNVFVTNK